MRATTGLAVLLCGFVMACSSTPDGTAVALDTLELSDATDVSVPDVPEISGPDTPEEPDDVEARPDDLQNPSEDTATDDVVEGEDVEEDVASSEDTTSVEPSCLGECGDSVCDAFEDCQGCPADCGECSTGCGDGVVGAGESCDDGNPASDDFCADCTAQGVELHAEAGHASPILVDGEGRVHVLAASKTDVTLYSLDAEGRQWRDPVSPFPFEGAKSTPLMTLTSPDTILAAVAIDSQVSVRRLSTGCEPAWAPADHAVPVLEISDGGGALVSPAPGRALLAWSRAAGDVQEIVAVELDDVPSVVGEPLVVSGSPGTSARGARAAALLDGSTVVLWRSYPADAPTRVMARRVASDLTVMEDPWEVNSTAPGAQNAAEVVALPAGGFVVAWGEVQGGSKEAMVRRFDASAAPVGMPERVNLDLPGFQFPHGLGVRPDGSFIVAWHDGLGCEGGCAGEDLLARRYGPDGKPLDAAAIQLPFDPAGTQAFAQFAATNAGYIMTWYTDAKVWARSLPASP